MKEKGPATDLETNATEPEFKPDDGPGVEPKPAADADSVGPTESEKLSEPQSSASPQAEDGHIDIANELAEAFRRINLSAYESRIIWTILRETWGWHRKMAPISLTDFQKATGLDRSNISKTLSKLLRRNIIKKGIEIKKKFRRYSGDSDNANSVTYGIQKDYLKWKGSGYSHPPSGDSYHQKGGDSYHRC